jgi:predicted glycoside hydrolase/deacetylase ChbG (UPF0249 family)
MPRNYVRFLFARRMDVEPELRAQIEKVLAAGLHVTHLNGHQHLHMLPRVRRVVQRLAREYGIGYVRVVNDRGGRARRIQMKVLNRVGAAALGNAARPGAGAPTRRYTIGVAEAGHLSAKRIIDLLDYVAGVTELVAHPGVGVRGYAHWRYAWDEETRALCDPGVREAIAARGIELIAPSALRDRPADL